MNAREIAEVCHEANRALQHIFFDPYPSKPWKEESLEIQESTINGVNEVSANPLWNAIDLHNEWLEYKAEQGWIWGPAKSEEYKTHPCMLPWDQLPPEQQIKDRLFLAICRVLLNNGRS